MSREPASPPLEIHIDGASRGNPGEAGFGVHVSAPPGAEARLSGYLGRATNNVAEYQALLHALRHALARGARRVRVLSDSELVTASRWFIYYYFFMTFAYVAAGILGLVQPASVLTVSSALGLISVLGLVLLLVLRWRGGPQAFAGAGMAGGNWRIWLLYGLGLVLFCALETLLNYVLKLGQPADVTAIYPPGATAGMPPMLLMGSTFFNMVILGPLLGLIISFGEEYGWRGYLQSELVRLGRVRGVGLLRAAWHLSPDASAALTFYDQRGKARAQVRVDRDGAPGLLLFDRSGNGRAMLRADAEGSPHLTLTDPAANSRAVLRVEPNGSPGLVFYDHTGQSRATLYVVADGSATLQLSDKAERVFWRVP